MACQTVDICLEGVGVGFLLEHLSQVLGYWNVGINSSNSTSQALWARPVNLAVADHLPVIAKCGGSSTNGETLAASLLNNFGCGVNNLTVALGSLIRPASENAMRIG